ncbi:uncharacterized protein LOC131009728 [Salvia miltiorrhiza]|uniref:uncharacterized protein LOC131009728 n=1 Tax=Salvia miltiorrhiza TaxID=226208 RepID=UPI0025AD97FC|nr:uncharacterized protein LOC131009728 [Salvia miltiorrhiza]
MPSSSSSSSPPSSSSSQAATSNVLKSSPNLCNNFTKLLTIGPPESPPRRRRVNKKAYIHRDREVGAKRLHDDYFVENPGYTNAIFRCRFRRANYHPRSCRISRSVDLQCVFWNSGSNNYINVLNSSTLFNDRLEGRAPPITYQVNNSYYMSGFYLIDDFYLDRPTFVKSPPFSSDENNRRFKMMQEAAHKDIERAFGMLQARWTIIKGPTRLWKKEELSNIMFMCIILHNVIIQDEGEHASKWEEDVTDEALSSSAAAHSCIGASPEFQAYVARQASMRDHDIHVRLTSDLKEHIWSPFWFNILNPRKLM